jgi:ketosteroid isomerase-like protein
MADHRHEWDDAVMSGDLELAMAEFQRCIAERDVEAATVVLDADYALVLVQPVAAVVPKDRWLAALPDYIVHSYDVREQLVDVDGDVAAVLHRAQMHATVGGVDRSGVFVVTDIWRRRDGRWRVWKRHSTPLTAGPVRSC